MAVCQYRELKSKIVQHQADAVRSLKIEIIRLGVSKQKVLRKEDLSSCTTVCACEQKLRQIQELSGRQSLRFT